MTPKFRKIPVILLAALLFMVNMPLSAQSTLKHTVDIGETLASIARRYGTTEARIIEINPEAADFIYVGMQLTIPLASAPQSAENSGQAHDGPDAFETETILPLLQQQTDVSVQGTVEKDSPGTWRKEEDERKWTFYEVQFMATSFKSVKASGKYGLGVIALPWEVAPDLCVGGHMSLAVNFGLASKGWETFTAMFGPQLGYYFTPAVFLAVPLDVVCETMVGSNTKQLEQIGAEDTFWGLSLLPSIYIGKKFGVYAGLVLNIPFVDNAEVTCGFRTGIYF